MLYLLGVFDSILNFFRGMSTVVQCVIFVVVLLAMLMTFRQTLKNKGGYNIGWLIVTILLFIFLLFFVYAVF